MWVHVQEFQRMTAHTRTKVCSHEYRCEEEEAAAKKKQVLRETMRAKLTDLGKDSHSCSKWTVSINIWLKDVKRFGGIARVGFFH